MAELICIPYSPWSEKARWALDVRGVEYKKRTYRPLIGEPALRWTVGRWRGPVSVPVLRTGGRVIADSLAIAKFADGVGSGPRLFPEGQEARIESYNELSERGLAAGRSLALMRALEDPDALLELVPKPMRKLGPLAVAIARAGIQRTMRKYGGDRASAESHEQRLTEVLDQLRRDLADAPEGDPKTLLGQLTYADIAMAQVLAFVDPPTSGLRVGEANRRAFRDSGLSERYRDLLEWRNALYARYRAP